MSEDRGTDRRPTKFLRGALLCTLVLSFSLIPEDGAAGLYADELAKCLVAATTAEDRNFLVKWMFAAMATHPEVKAMSAVSPEQSERLVSGTARLLERLLTQSCKTQAKQAVEFEGGATIQASFSVLGNVAARGLFAHPDVASFSAKLDEHIDAEGLQRSLGIQP